MIKVQPKPEPEGFDRDVRKKGLKWLKDKGISFDEAPPDPSKLPAYWRDYNRHLWEAYSGICAYLAIYIESPSGAASTDHFIAKSRKAEGIYEWSNYRLANLGPNRNKGAFDDILDPFELSGDVFYLEFASGAIYPNPGLGKETMKAANRTIERLKLDDKDCNDMRARHFEEYIANQVTEAYLRKKSPFVWSEVRRQGLLRN